MNVSPVFSRFSCAPRETHWFHLQQVVRYLSHTKHLCLTYGGARYIGKPLDFLAYSDSDYATDKQSRKSQAGYCILFLGSSVTWKSRQISSVVQSSCEAEYVIAAITANVIKGLSQFMAQLELDIVRPMPLFIDNTSAIIVSHNPSKGSSLKHVDVRYAKIREYIMSRLIKPMHIPTARQTADTMTKVLLFILHHRHTMGLGLFPHSSVEESSPQ